MDQEPVPEQETSSDAAPPPKPRPGPTLPLLIGAALVVAVVGVALVLLTSGSSSDADDSARPDATLAEARAVIGPTSLMAQADDSSALPGTYVPPHPGADGILCNQPACLSDYDDRNHVDGPIPICSQEQIASNQITGCYHSNPPTSGPHAGHPAPWGVLASPAPKEVLVHNMEHGGVVIWYNTQNAQVISQLQTITNAAVARRLLVVMSAYPGMEPETIALTGWTRLDKFAADQFDPQRVINFINRHDRRFNPEDF